MTSSRSMLMYQPSPSWVRPLPCPPTCTRVSPIASHPRSATDSEITSRSWSQVTASAPVANGCGSHSMFDPWTRPWKSSRLPGGGVFLMPRNTIPTRDPSPSQLHSAVVSAAGSAPSAVTRSDLATTAPVRSMTTTLSFAATAARRESGDQRTAPRSLSPSSRNALRPSSTRSSLNITSSVSTEIATAEPSGDQAKFGACSIGFSATVLRSKSGMANTTSSRVPSSAGAFTASNPLPVGDQAILTKLVSSLV